MNYYDFNKNGYLVKVKEDSRISVGLKYLSAKKAEELSGGKYKESGWLYSDDITPPSHYSGSDALGEGVQGIRSMADGKMYDSKTAYNKHLKENGLVCVGDDAPTTPRKPKESGIDWKAELRKTYSQLQAKNPKKGKKR